MSIVHIIPATIEHIDPIAERMRRPDKEEVLASSGKSPHEALAFSLRSSDWAWTAIVDDVPEVMFGAASLNVLSRTGAPWLLGTDAVEKNYRLFLRSSVYWRKQLSWRYDILRNYVDDRNEVSKRWLSWLGFTLFDPIPVGVNGELFRLFELRA